MGQGRGGETELRLLTCENEVLVKSGSRTSRRERLRSDLFSRQVISGRQSLVVSAALKNFQLRQLRVLLKKQEPIHPLLGGPIPPPKTFLRFFVTFAFILPW